MSTFTEIDVSFPSKSLKVKAVAHPGVLNEEHRSSAEGANIEYRGATSAEGWGLGEGVPLPNRGGATPRNFINFLPLNSAFCVYSDTSLDS